MNAPHQPNSFRTGPDDRGHFGIYGGRYVAETLMPPLLTLEAAYAEAKTERFRKRWTDICKIRSADRRRCI
jgi:tryptophan synthase beta chain